VIIIVDVDPVHLHIYCVALDAEDPIVPDDVVVVVPELVTEHNILQLVQ